MIDEVGAIEAFVAFYVFAGPTGPAAACNCLKGKLSIRMGNGQWP